MFKILCLVVLAAFIFGAGEALRCYGCVASTTSDCYEGVQPSYIHQDCLFVANSDLTMLKRFMPKNPNKSVRLDTYCVSVVLDDFQPKMFQRGCSRTFEGVDVCEFLSSVANVSSCSSCKSDFCNSSPIVQL